MLGLAGGSLGFNRVARHFGMVNCKTQASWIDFQTSLGELLLPYRYYTVLFGSSFRIWNSSSMNIDAILLFNVISLVSSPLHVEKQG